MRKLILGIWWFIALPSVAQDADSTKSGAGDTLRVSTLNEVTVTGKKPLFQVFADRTVVNVDAAVTNTGSTALEVLERSPGITLDRNGNISIKGRQGVLVMIDGRPTQLAGADLNTLLSSLSAAQIDQIEIIDNPSSKYDAAGNAGVINIKTKKNRQKGLNGNINLSLAQGQLTRSYNTAAINYFAGKVNWFAQVTGNLNQNFTNLYALRNYYLEDNKTVTSILEQPSYFKGRLPTATVKTGADFNLSPKTTAGVVFTGTRYSRNSKGNNRAIWMDAAGNTDSVIITSGDNHDKFASYAINLNGRHAFNGQREITADLDFLGYRINNRQFFNNTLEGNNGYSEDITGLLPANINIFTGKADYTERFANLLKLEAGWKSSHITTDNRAAYFRRTGSVTVPDYDRTNHFLYEENIHAAYLNLEKKTGKWNFQGGLRYEYTGYEAKQLGNPVRKDSSFSRNYDGLFPNFLASVQSDSSHNFSLTAGRRIDRPQFQSLNPFVFIINKYTYQAGNPFFRPQYTWNTELTHNYKNVLVTSISFSTTRDYFSQIFLQDSNGIITYTEGNLDWMQNTGLSLSVNTPIATWWTLSAQGVVNHKRIKGFIWTERRASLTQANFNINNQFNFGKGWSGEISAFFTLREQELQEITDPTGQLGAGIVKSIFDNRGTIRFTVRDIFYTQAMKGFTTFEQSTEYFKIVRDSRYASIGFSYRFGGNARSAPRRTSGAEDEMRRVNTAG